MLGERTGPSSRLIKRKLPTSFSTTAVHWAPCCVDSPCTSSSPTWKSSELTAQSIRRMLRRVCRPWTLCHCKTWPWLSPLRLRIWKQPQCRPELLLSVIMENLFYPLTLVALYQVFSKFCTILKILPGAAKACWPVNGWPEHSQSLQHAAQLLLQGHRPQPQGQWQKQALHLPRPAVWRWLGILDLTMVEALCLSVPNIHRELAPLAILCAATETTAVWIAILGLAGAGDSILLVNHLNPERVIL